MALRTARLLLEDGGYLLLEDGGYLLLDGYPDVDDGGSVTATAHGHIFRIAQPGDASNDDDEALVLLLTA